MHLYRLRAALSSWYSYLDTKEIDIYLPPVLETLKLVVPYKLLLNQTLWVLINFANNPEISIDFLFKDYEFIQTLKQIFKEYDYNDNEQIYEHIYWLLGNICSSEKRVRNEIIQNDFLDHLAYMFTDKSIILTPYSINTFVYALSFFVSKRIESIHLRYFLCLVDPLKKLLLYKRDSEVLDSLLYIYSKLLSYSDPNSELFNDLINDELIKMVIKSYVNLDMNDSISSKAHHFDSFLILRLICNIASGDDRYVTQLINSDVMGIIEKNIFQNDVRLSIAVSAFKSLLYLIGSKLIIEYH